MPEQVLKFGTKAGIRVMPTEHRTPHRQYVGICHAGPPPSSVQHDDFSSYCPGKIGSADGSDLRTALSLTGESPFGQPSVTGAGRAIYVPELSRSGSHELASRTGHSPDGGDPQSLGRKSNLARSTYPKYSGEHSANLPAATPLRFFYSSKADLRRSAQASGLNCPYTLNNYFSSS